MTEKQRFEYDYKTGRIYDNESNWHGTKNPLHSVQKLNTFDRRYKQLEKENEELKHQLSQQEMEYATDKDNFTWDNPIMFDKENGRFRCIPIPPNKK